MEKAFHAKAQEVLSGKTAILSTSPYKSPLPAAFAGDMTPGQDTILRTLQNSAIGFGGGLLYGACQIAWYPDNVQDNRGRFYDAFSVRSVGAKVLQPTIFMGVAMGTFTFSQCSFETVREIRDPWNAVYAGAITGFLASFMFRKRFDKALFSALGTGFGMGFADIAGALFMYEPDHETPVLRPKTYVESEELRALKDLYPKYKDL